MKTGIRVFRLGVVLCGLFGAACVSACKSSAKNDLSDFAAVTSPDLINKAAHILRVSTDGQGQIASVVVIKSSGSAIVDRAAIDYIKKHYQGSPNIRRDVVLYFSR